MNAKRDENRIPSLLGTSSIDGETPVIVKVEPSTGSVLTKDSDVVTQLEVMNSLVPNKYDSVVITYTDSTKKTIDNVVFKLDGTTVQTISLVQATLTDTWARS
jgi:hypothetical protein